MLVPVFGLLVQDYYAVLALNRRATVFCLEVAGEDEDDHVSVTESV